MTTTTIIPSLDELFSEYLGSSSVEHPEAASEIQPYQMSPALRIDAKQAWNDALFPMHPIPGKLKQPDEWLRMLHQSQAKLRIWFAVGSTPQQLAEPAVLLSQNRLSPPSDLVSQESLRSRLLKQRDVALSAKDLANTLLSCGLLREMGAYEDALIGLRAIPTAELPSELLAIVRNEEAVILWEQGNHSTAEAIWAEQPDHVGSQINWRLTQGWAGTAQAKSLIEFQAHMTEHSGWFEWLAFEQIVWECRRNEKTE
ncbi:hypothetical protein [Tuwongella immobilis]|uniref:Uncharacterized protein n=1 Tax=Tuwongella immobilis TaxID=692036 RepID=A0A6C2YM52_9BACT|nr:hypothetical protein [Tuwongella immobilis]VIP02437.1 unnamed protein product [Tuwongella immobilis]VTS01395.1 unnamed protein product [Tuwongella immobilis]